MARLTRDDWIQFGLMILKTEGYAQLKAGALAKRLNVTRGSFYWHFEDLQTYHEALLDHWCRISADTAQELDNTASPRRQLNALFVATTKADFELEHAFRAWGREEQNVATRIDRLDEMRLAVVNAIIEKELEDPASAAMRAKFTYAAAIGLTSLGNDKVGLSDKDLQILVEIILGKHKAALPK